MSQRLAVLPFVAMSLLFGMLIAACSSDSDDTGNGGADTDATEPADDGDGDGDATEPADDGDGDGDGDGDADGDGDGEGGSSGSGSATLTVGDESWSSVNVACAFTPEESHSDQISFRMIGASETAEGAPVQIQATIQDTEAEGRYEGNGVIHIVEVIDAEDLDNPALNWLQTIEIFDELEPVIKVDGKNVTANATFDDRLTATDFEDVPGTLLAVCP